MRHIDAYLEGNTATSSSDGRRSPDHRQAWLKAMDDAGLRNALDNTRNFPGAVLKPEVLVSITGEALTHPGRQAGAQQSLADAPTRQTVANTAEVDRAAAVELTAAGPEAATDGQAFAHSGPGSQSSRSAADGESEADVGCAPLRTFTQAKTQWTPRKMTVLPLADAAGVEVWIRDAAVSGAQMQMLLAELRRGAPQYRGEIAQISLNGRPVYITPSKRAPRNKAEGD